MNDYFGIMELISAGEYYDIALLSYLHQYGIVFWVAIWALLMIVIYIKVGDLTVVTVLSGIMFASVAVYSTAYDFFPVQAVAFAFVAISLISAGIFYRYYSRMR